MKNNRFLSRVGNRETVVKICAVLVPVLFAVVLLRTAWISDDAYITLRTVDNFVNGHGLRWNVAERTQSFTSPLWTLLISVFYALTGEAYYTLLILSIVISFLTVSAVVFLYMKKPGTGLLAGLLLLCSKAFTDYSTSGLENPLSHLLFVLFYWYYFIRGPEKTRVFFLSLLSSLIVCNRMDLFLFVFPVLAYELFLRKFSLKRLVHASAGFAPFIFWELFSVVYYGFPFPNTAYAKLNSGIEWHRLVEQGGFYVYDFAVNDLIGALAVAGGVLYLGRSCIKKRSSSCLLFVGMLLYLVYILKIGGDFMSGRFFSVMILLSVLSLAEITFSTRTAVIVSAFVCIAGMLVPNSPLLSGEDYINADIPSSGVADERGYFFRYTGLFNGKPFSKKPEDPFRNKGRRKGELIIKDGVGMSGFHFGPDHYILDRYALSDAFLARIPFEFPREDRDFRPGHLGRRFPEGYDRTVRTGKNSIRHRGLHSFYDSLLIIIRDDLFSFNRFREIFRMNFGLYDHFIEDYSQNLVLYGDTMRSTFEKSVVNEPLRKGRSYKLRCGDQNLEHGGFLVFGPYISLDKGCYRARYHTALVSPEGKNSKKNIDTEASVLELDVFRSRYVLTAEMLSVSDLEPAERFQDTDLYFYLPERRDRMEFRAFYKPSVKICLDSITVKKLSVDVCDKHGVSRRYFGNDLLLNMISEDGSVVRPQLSFPENVKYALSINTEKNEDIFPLTILWTSPEGDVCEKQMSDVTNQPIHPDCKGFNPHSPGVRQVSVISRDDLVLEKKSFRVLQTGKLISPLLSMRIVSSSEQLGDLVLPDDKISVQCRFDRSLWRKRIIIDWIDPDGNVAFSSYHSADFSRMKKRFPYFGPMPMKSGMWRLSARIVTFVDPREDIFLGETTFIVGPDEQNGDGSDSN